MRIGLDAPLKREYEVVIVNLEELSDRVEIEDTVAESIQEPTSINR